MSHNTLIHRIVRPAVRLIAPTGATPNQVTTLRLATGAASIALFACGPGVWMNVAGVIFLISMLLDRADGELARQTNQMSLAGHRYDLWCDCTVNAATFIGIGASFSAKDAGLGGVAGFAIVILFWQLNVVKVAAVRTFSFMKGSVNIDPDDAMVLVPVLVWLGLARPMLLAAAIITPLVVLWIAFTSSSSKSEINNSAGGR